MDTRAESYELTKPSIGQRQREVLDTLQSNPFGLTAWELSDILKRQVYVVRPRLTELYNLGYVEKIGVRFHDGTQRNEWVYKIASKDRQLNLI